MGHVHQDIILQLQIMLLSARKDSCNMLQLFVSYFTKIFSTYGFTEYNTNPLHTYWKRQVFLLNCNSLLMMVRKTAKEHLFVSEISLIAFNLLYLKFYRTLYFFLYEFQIHMNIFEKKKKKKKKS